LKRQCQFRGEGCLSEFEARSPNQKNCAVCQKSAKKAHNTAKANAVYKANPAKFAKRTRENRWKRKKAAGRPVLRIGALCRCQYRNQRGKRGAGCLVKFARKSSFQKFCEVCRKHADADRAQNYRDVHREELRPMYRAKGKRLRELAATGRDVENIVESAKEKKLVKAIALYLKAEPNAGDGELLEIFTASVRTIRRAKDVAGVPKKLGRPKSL
jgi:hypothetical protein